MQIDEYIPKGFVPKMPFLVYDEGIITDVYFGVPFKELKETSELIMYGKTSAGTPYISALEFWHLRDIWNSKDNPERFI